MGKVVTELSMSLDGFVAGPNDSPDQGLGDDGISLFKWYNSGEVAFPLRGTDMVFHISQASADVLQTQWDAQGAFVAGRRMFDITQGWDGRPPGGVPSFIVTHHPPQEWIKPGSPYTFVTDGVESAIAQARQAAGDKNVSLGSASIVQQAIKAGLLDEIQIDLAPVLLGGGVSLFGHLGSGGIQLENIGVVVGTGVTHLRFRVVK